MKNTYKRVPFNVELAKKIQSGEVEGRIITKDGESVRIVCFDMDNEILKLVGIVRCESTHQEEYSVTYTSKGFRYDNINSVKNPDLLIELPEEAPKQLTLNDCYVGDKVWVKHKDNDILVKIKDKNPNGLIYVSNLMSNSEELYFAEGTRVYSQKPEFKPFDKVLVRNEGDTNNKWFPAVYGYRSDVVGHITIDHRMYEECIPYEGNEHLVGTTDNP